MYRLALLALLLPTTALANSIDLSAFGWDVTFTNETQLSVVSASSSSLVLSLNKTTNFNLHDVGTSKPTISMVFHQLSRSATPQIVIDKETITNNSDHDWAGYQYSLTAPHETNQTSFDTNASKGFAANPFPNQSYFINYPNYATNAYFTGGTLKRGDSLTLGNNGNLVINAGPFNDNTYPSYYQQIFALNETPLLQSDLGQGGIPNGGGGGGNIIPLPNPALLTLAGLPLAAIALKLTRNQKP
jgi:hypothetical protein